MAPNSNPVEGALVERAWRGYDPRAALPLITIAATASAALLAGRWYLNDFTAALVPYLLVLVIWPCLLGPAMYRAITFTYRITDRALLVDRGFLTRPEPPIWMNEITCLTSGSNWLHRQLGLGWVHVESADGRTVTLSSLRDPAAFAVILREQMKASKQEAPAS